MNYTIDIAANLALVRQRMAAAARRVGRSPDEVVLLAVSKTHPAALIEQALAAGQRAFGENLVEEAWAKFGDPGSPLAGPPDAAARPRLHLIGPIQSRKAALAVACRPALIHAVDRLKIAARLDRFAREAGLALDVLLEVNVAGEASKFGFTPDAVRRDTETILALPNLRVRGLMTIPPYEPDPEAARPHFAALRRLQGELAQRYPQADWRHLSMGMSHDFEAAIEEGATIVRVGTAIFGTRET
ncbi:MAG TPA: YggS family pyridoxal phosphate-dependent enzyme [Anaerolineae bacterium]|nr:YggS family pyridoxal phosphate-dependent enzyme [Anaerolineae bacterium]